MADGIVITPSHNPPEDGGFKYNPPNGGPADTDVTAWVQRRANELLRARLDGVKRIALERALAAETTHQEDLVLPYVRDLQHVVDMDAIRGAGLTMGVDPLGGASAPYWEPINALYGTQITVVNPTLDATFSFMTVDHDGRIRMDPSSPHAMASLVGLEGSLPGGVRQRSGRGPPRDRDSFKRTAEPEPLSGGRDPLPADAPARVAGRRRGGQDARQQQPDRSGRRHTRPPPAGGAGRLQVVRAGAVRRLVLLRRRGERRRQLPAPRRHRLVHRQGRADHGFARGGDHRADGQGSRASTTRSSRRSSAHPITRASMRRPRRIRRRACSGCRRRT